MSMMMFKLTKAFLFAISLFFLNGCTGNSGGVVVNENNSDKTETLRVHTEEGYKRYEREQIGGSKFIRLWVTQESNSISSGSKYGGGVKRNVGYIDPQSLKNAWYFETNNQNIVSQSDLYSFSDDQVKSWRGTIYAVISQDSDDNGRLAYGDKVDLYYANDNVFSLIYEGGGDLEEVFAHENSSTLMIREGEDLLAGSLDYNTLLLKPVRQIDAPK